LLFDDTRKIQNLIKNFLDHQYEVNHLTPKTVHCYYDAIKHFYQSNEVTLNWHVMKDYVGTGSHISANIDRPYTYSEISRMLEKCDERKRCIVLLLCSTGVRRGAIPELKVGHLKWIDQYQIYEIQVYAGFPDAYTVWCSLECASAIRSYLDFRRRSGEEITEDSYVIRKQFNKENPANRIHGSRPNDPPEKHKISLTNLETTLYRLIYDAGIRNYQDKKKRNGIATRTWPPTRTASFLRIGALNPVWTHSMSRS
jgi:integrase